MKPLNYTDYKLLIVDDNPENLKILFRCLEISNFEVLVARNGESALQKAVYVKPDLILLDVMMPGIDGFETCKRLRDNPITHDIPVILMTALSDVQDKVKGLDSGAVDYVTKPFQYEEILARVHVHLKTRQLMKELDEKNQQLIQEINERKASEYNLQQALEKLSQTQAQLVHSEKMSGLGQMMAGISHELNNPLGFITGNISFVRDYTKQLIWIIEQYQTCISDRDLGLDLDDVINFSDLDYMIEDIPKALNSIEVGTSRIVEIIDRLKNFSGLQQEGQKVIDIQDNLNRIIDMMDYRLQATDDRPTIKVIKHYDADPSILCYPEQINQAFLNLITNAIDAIDSGYEMPKMQCLEVNKTFDSPTLTLQIECVSDRIKVHVVNNGPGIPDDLQSRIFDPFFTTKAVGKGVGLGLAICYHIITVTHQGTLTCHSSAQGTKFIIELPLGP